MYTSESEYSLYAVREVANYLFKRLVLALTPYLKEMQTTEVYLSAKSSMDTVLSLASRNEYIKNNYVSVVSPDSDEIDAIVADVEFETIKPISTIKLNIVVK